MIWRTFLLAPDSSAALRANAGMPAIAPTVAAPCTRKSRLETPNNRLLTFFTPRIFMAECGIDSVAPHVKDYEVHPPGSRRLNGLKF